VSDITILDGAMGSLLEASGVEVSLPLWSARALVEQPAAVRDVHRRYIEAGAEVITTCTFRTHGRSLAPAGLAEQAGVLTRRAVDLVRDAAEAAGAPAVRVAGGISPLEDCYEPTRSPGYDEALREHRIMAGDLAGADIDLLLIETMPAWAEARAALDAAFETGRPVWLSLAMRDADHLLGGESVRQCLETLKRWPDAILANCMPLDVAPACVATLRQVAPDDVPVGVYPNLGRIVDGAWTTDDRVEAVALTTAARRWVDAGATIIGGCCGSTPMHIAALAGAFGHESPLRPR
jgi:homocysteine S-methyltransferase